MVSPTECLWHYCGEFWIFALTVADIISDFLYFEELYVENKVCGVGSFRATCLLVFFVVFGALLFFSCMVYSILLQPAGSCYDRID